MFSVIAFSTMILGAALTTQTAFFDDLHGTWTCGEATWTIARAPGNSAWTTVTYGKGDLTYGTAYVGWVPQLQRYVYRDFHNDGPIAELTSPAAMNGMWTWTGSYYPASGSVDESARITWSYQAPNVLVRHFDNVHAGKYTEVDSDRCTRTP